jgi:hypothetical protein
MTRTQWYLPDDLKLEAEMEAKLLNMPVSEIFRKALRAYLDEQKKLRLKTRKDPFAKIIGTLTCPEDWKDLKPHELSKKIDDAIYGDFD